MTPTKATLEITKDEYTRTLFDEKGKVIARERMVRYGRGSFKGVKEDRVQLPDEPEFYRMEEDFESLCGMDMAQELKDYEEDDKDELDDEEDED